MSPQFNNQYSPYQNMYMQNVLPQQQVTQVNGKASVDAIKMAPNSSVLLLDNTAPIIWLCVSDGLGNVTSKAYDISPHQDKPPIDLDAIVKRIDNIESIISEMENTNGKSNDGNAKPRDGKKQLNGQGNRDNQ